MNFLVNAVVTMVQVQARASSNAGVKYYKLGYKKNATAEYSPYKDVVVNFGAGDPGWAAPKV